MNTQKDWSEYYKLTSEKPPSKLLVKALPLVAHKGKAVDIGGGALKDTRHLLAEGFDVTVIDASESVREAAHALDNENVHAYISRFEDFNFPENTYDIASAMFALPFTSPTHFTEVFERIEKSLVPGGIFCGQFFGKNDGWAQNPNMTFHTKAEIETLLSRFDTLSFSETKEDGTTANGAPKHWHIFEIIARK